MRNEFILLVELIFGIAFLSSMIWDYFRKKKYYQNLWNVFDSLDDKTLLAELLDSPMFLDGKTVYQVLRHTNKFMSNRILQADATNQEYREYIEMWIHEVKTPITSAHLIIENDKNMTTLRIDDEIHKIEQYVLAESDICGETDITAYLKTRDVDMTEYAQKTEQISLYEADVTYGELFEGQNVDLWNIDKDIPQMGVSVISITDFNRSLVLQGKSEYTLDDNSFLLNCNYNGTRCRL